MAQDKNKQVSQITDMEADFAQWFTDVCKKAELIDELKKAATEQQAAPPEGQPAPQPSAPGANLPTQGGQLTTDKVVNSLPPSVQSKYAQLPRGTRNALGRMATMRGL